jgi:hypothetical protein
MPVRPSTAATAGPSVHAFCRSATFIVLQLTIGITEHAGGSGSGNSCSAD